MTMDIAKLKELVGAATPGGWEWRTTNITQVGTGLADPLTATGLATMTGRRELAEANAALVVAAVNALPSLIARVEAAEKVVEAARVIHETGYRVADHFRLEAALTTYDQEKARG